MKVLLVNDEPATLLILESMFKYSLKISTISKASNGLEAIDKAIGMDLVIMDLNMPIMDGYASCRKIKDREPSPYVIAVSASNFSPDMLSHCKDSGFDDQFVSPLTVIDIRMKVLPKVLENALSGSSISESS